MKDRNIESTVCFFFPDIVQSPLNRPTRQIFVGSMKPSDMMEKAKKLWLHTSTSWLDFFNKAMNHEVSHIDVLDLAVSSYLPYQTYPTWQRENMSGETYQLDSELKDWVGLYRSLALFCQCFVVFFFQTTLYIHMHPLLV